MNERKTALMIARTQGGHNGYLSALEQAASQGITKILYGVGSADKERTPDNPFTYPEREKIVKVLIEVFHETHPDVEVSIHPIQDFGDNKQWKDYIENTLPEFSAVISSNTNVSQLWPDKEIISPEMYTPYRGTHIRYQLTREDWKTLEQSVHPKVLELLREMKAPEILQSIEKIQPMAPRIATDLIIIHNGKYVLGNRKHAPYGLALIGGMLDPGETLEQCAHREGLEELFSPDDTEAKLQLISSDPYTVLSNPDRDPRGRVISAVYEAQILGGNPIGSDDITELFYYTPQELINIADEEFAFLDHKQTLVRHAQKFL